MDKIVIKNALSPMSEMDECVVARYVDGEYWFYCSYQEVTKAVEAARFINNGVVLHKDWCKNEEQEFASSSELSPMLKQFVDLKKKHPDALLLFRCGDFYETYMKDAENASKVLGITLTRSIKQKDIEGKPLAMAGFPYHALDCYLPKLVRAGHRIAICDQIEVPKQTLAKRGIQEMVTPNK